MAHPDLLGALCAILWTFILITGLCGVVFWLWMLIDCMLNDDEDKTVWLLVVISFYALGALVYLVVVRRSRRIAETPQQNEVYGATVAKDGFHVTFGNGMERFHIWSKFEKLAHASAAERESMQVSGSRKSIIWSKLGLVLTAEELLYD